MTPQADIARSLEFLRWLHGRMGVYSVGAIDPDDTRGLAWLTTEDLGEVERFLAEQGALRRNLYYQVNACGPALGHNRAGKDDVAYACAAHVDVDPPDTATDLASLRTWQAETAQRYEREDFWASAGLPSPSALVFSGSGFQVLWVYDEPVCLWREEGDDVAQDAMLLEHVEEINYSILQRIDPLHTGTHNADRLMRLPGTLNWPSAKKRAKGRTQPELAAGVWCDRRVDMFAMPRMTPPPRAAAPRGRVHVEPGQAVTREWLAANLPPWLYEDVVDGAGPGADRSKSGFAAVCALIRAGVTDETIAAIIGDPQYKISGHYVDQGDTQRAIERAIGAAHDQVDPDLEAEREFASWVARSAARSSQLPAASVTEPAPPPATFDVDAHFKAVQRKLSSRKDADSIRDAELLKRVNAGGFLTDDANDDRAAALCLAALAVARAAPDGMTQEQMVRRLTPSAGALASDLPEIVGIAVEQAREMGDILQRGARASEGGIPHDEFVLKKSGDDAGSPAPSSQHNFRVALYKLGVTFKYNAFAHQEIMMRTNDDGETVEQVVEDHHVDALSFEIERTFGFYPPVDKFFRFITTLAREQSFHPVLEYLAGLGTPTTSDLTQTWLIRFAGAEDTPYVRAISRLTLVAAVRRVRRPGEKFDELLVLEGTQGHGKSSALRSLVPDPAWFSDGLELGTDAKVVMEQTLGKWIIEVPEMHTRGADSKVKAMLSRQDDSARAAYMRKSSTRLRHFIPVGTTNEHQYLFDRTGNRRYWPVRVGEIDVAGLVAVRDALWAEAAALEAAGESIRLARELWPDAAKEQDKRQVDDPYQILLEDALGGYAGHIRIADVWKLLGFNDGRLPTRSEQMQIAAIMQGLGFERFKRQFGGTRAYYYERGDGIERDMLLKIEGNGGSGYRVRVAPPTPVAGPVGVPLPSHSYS